MQFHRKIPAVSFCVHPTPQVLNPLTIVQSHTKFRCVLFLRFLVLLGDEEAKNEEEEEVK